MQYAIIEINKEKNISRIIDASELYELKNLKKGEDIKEISPNENELILKLVYGAIVPQYDTDIAEIEAGVKMSINKALAYVKDGIANEFELVDIKLLNSEIENKIPFSALIHTNLKIDNKKHQSMSAFLRYKNMKVQDNILNRFGIFAIKEQENRIKEVLSKDNWKSFIDENRALRVASKVI
ncbi:hypothetical protein [Clostridium akagii]|uniref:hypothetical protein n=1 Tax=Clostridium akagii TaxID=91623 RepID=UPI00047AAAD3|nr:hypothetical protein [Clostridium akagii]